MRTALAVAALAAPLALVGCGGSSSSAPASEPVASQPAPAAAEPSAEDKLAAAQASAVRAMCERLVDCSVADAKATMSEAELAELKPEELVPRARAKCEAEWGALSLSPRQIKVIQRCVNEAQACPALDECLDAGNKK